MLDENSQLKLNNFQKRFREKLDIEIDVLVRLNPKKENSREHLFGYV